jgi:uncharacterized protein (TIGR03382 family)
MTGFPRTPGRLLSACVLAAGLAACGSTDRPIHTVDGPVDLGAETPPEPADGRRHPYLIQVEGRVDEEVEAAIAATGAIPERYFPDDALLVLATPGEAARARELPWVRAAAAMPASWRIDPALKAVRPDATAAVLVELAPGAEAAAVARAIADLGGQPGEAPASWLLEAHLPGRAIEPLAARPDVLYVAPAPEFRVANREARQVVEGETVDGAGPLAERGLRGQGQLVAVADGGVDLDSCYFAGDKVAAYEAWDDDGGDETGHGTHVAGSLAGDRHENGLADGNDGLAPAARLFVQDVGSRDDTSLDRVPADLGRLFRSAYRAGARIHSDSWGTPGATYGPVARSLDLFVADHPDFLVLVANGNSGPEEGSVGSPATAKNALSVGASGAGDRVDRVASFSSRGPTADGRVKPTLLAPGASITSAAAGRTCAVTTKQGTSMATPVLAGAAAVARQYFVDGYYPTGRATPGDGFSPSAALLRATLLAGAMPLEDGDPRETGFGRADLAGTLAPEPGRRLWVDDEGTGLEVGEEAAYEVELTAEGPLRIALAWTDVAGTSGSTKALVNDLDLVIDGPDGTFRGNVFAAGHSVIDGEPDRRNVEEVVALPEARPGTYRVRVVADNVPRGRQAFALAALGAIRVEKRFAGLAAAGGGDGSGDGSAGCSAAGGAASWGPWMLLALGIRLRRRAGRSGGRSQPPRLAFDPRAPGFRERTALGKDRTTAEPSSGRAAGGT